MGFDNGGYNPGSTAAFLDAFGKGQVGTVSAIAGLPPHLQVVRANGDPKMSLRRQFTKGKASKKNRGKS